MGLNVNRNAAGTTPVTTTGHLTNGGNGGNPANIGNTAVLAPDANGVGNGNAALKAAADSPLPPIDSNDSANDIPVGEMVGLDQGGQAPPQQVPPQPLTQDNKFSYWGDPHAVTGDHLAFDNAMAGKFVLLQSDSGDLSVQVDQEKSAGGAYVKQVAIKSGSDVVKYDVNNPNQIVIDGKTLPLANAQLPGGGNVQVSGGQIVVTTAAGDAINVGIPSYSNAEIGGGYLNISGTLSTSRAIDTVKGSLGVFDGGADPTDELQGRAGNVYNIQGAQNIAQQAAWADGNIYSTNDTVSVTAWQLGHEDPALVAFLNQWRVQPGEDLLS